MQPVAEILAGEYQKQNPGCKIFVQGGGSSAGIRAVIDGISDIGASSRELAADEKGLHEIVIARDGIAVIVHPELKIKSLNITQLKGIFSGSMRNWREVGGPDHEIIVVTREAGSGTRGAFEELVMDKTPIFQEALVQASTGTVKQTVVNTGYSIGYISLSALDEKMKGIGVNGAAPSVENIRNGSYLLARPFLFLTKNAPAGEVKKFIDFVLDGAGQKIIAEEGLVSVR